MISWCHSLSNVSIHEFTLVRGKRFIKKPGSAARCHTGRVLRGGRQNNGGGKKRGRKGSRRVRRLA